MKIKKLYNKFNYFNNLNKNNIRYIIQIFINGNKLKRIFPDINDVSLG